MGRIVVMEGGVNNVGRGRINRVEVGGCNMHFHRYLHFPLLYL